MNTVLDAIQHFTASVEAVSKAEADKRLAQATVMPLLRQRWEEYRRLFEPLWCRAQANGMSFPELPSAAFGDWSNRLGSRLVTEIWFRKVASLSFAVVATMDHLGGDFEALIPMAFLAGDSEEAMQAACGRIREQMSAHEAEAERQAALSAEERDREMLADLLRKYPPAGN